MKRTRMAAAAAALALTACAQTDDVVHEPDPPVAVQASSSAPSATSTAAAERRTYTLKVSGMTCPVRCPLEVKDQLRAVPGVLKVEVDTDTRRAVVEVAPGTDPETLVHALHEPYSGKLM